MPAGRPRKYETVEELEQLIEEYFELSEGEPLLDAEGAPVTYKGQVVMVKGYHPTVTGLALHLGLRSRQAVLNYQGRPEFNDAITRAKLKIEDYANQRLFDKDGVQGAKFTLTNNYEGYKEKTETDLNIKEIPQIILKRFEKE